MIPKNPPTPRNQFTVTINGVNVTRHVPFPIKYNDLLDERLDEARITVKHRPEKVFPHMSRVEIYFKDRYDNTYEKAYVVAEDIGIETPPGSGYYNHEMSLIEETKLLEGFIIDTLTFTNDLGRIYTKNAHSVEPNVDWTGRQPKPPNNPESYKTPVSSSLFIIKGIEYLYPEIIAQAIAYSHTVDLYRNEELVLHREKENSLIGDITYDLSTGEYKLVYDLKYMVDMTRQDTVTVTYIFYAVENTDPLPVWNVASVIDRVLDLAEPRREGLGVPRYTLDPNLRAKLEGIIAPEFAFTNNTLKEALDQIGGFIHAIPRLRGNIVTYEFLGEPEMSPCAGYPTYVFNSYAQNIEQFCTKIDSRVDNIVNVLDEEQGTIKEPYYDGFQTVRTETAYARITDAGMIIETKLPIYSVKSLTAGILPGTDYRGGDLTPYVFESADYNRMESTKELYPDSKAYAIYFTQGEKNIRGLNFKVPHPVNDSLKKYSIVNILRNTSGHNEFDIGIPGPDAEVNVAYPRLAFQISYTPIFASRVQQSKSLIGNGLEPRTLAYNQGANIVESRYFGENMKGVVARLGNVDMMKTFLCRKLTSIPKAGQLFDEDYYISGVAVEFACYDMKVTLALSKNFNRISQYIGINSQKRYYEVSEKSAYDRDMNYTDYLVIGDEVTPENTVVGNNSGLNGIVNTFRQSGLPITSVALKGISQGGNPLQQIILPVVSTAFGNSILFTAAYEDNYSAGNQAAFYDQGGVSGYFQQGVAYCDPYGRLERLNASFFDSIPAPGNFDQQTNIGTKLPAYDGALPTPFFGTDGNPFVVRKDSRERLALNYQVEFVTNRQHLIVGSAFARNCPLIRTARPGHFAQLYVLPKTIGKFSDKLDLTKATKVADYNTSSMVYVVNGRIELKASNAPVGGAAWAMVDASTGELLFGQNGEVVAGSKIDLPVITPRHNLFNMKEEIW